MPERLEAPDRAEPTRSSRRLPPRSVASLFTVYALATPTLEVKGPLTGANVPVMLVSAGVLGQASITGTYSLNSTHF